MAARTNDPCDRTRRQFAAAARPLTVACCLLLLAALTPDPVSACSCMVPGPPCQEFWRADAVFTGRVTAVEPFSDREEVLTEAGWVNVSMLSRRVTMTIIEAHRGVSGRTVTIYTGSGGGDCGYPFQVGEAYFVYADNYPRQTPETPARPTRLYAGICSRTAPLHTAAEDLKHAREVRAGAVRAGTISGFVRRVPAHMAPEVNAKPQPVPDIRVRLFGPGPVREAVTDTSGRFEFGPLAVGVYTVITVAPPGFQASMSNEPITIKDTRQCATMNITLTATR